MVMPPMRPNVDECADKCAEAKPSARNLVLRYTVDHEWRVMIGSGRLSIADALHQAINQSGVSMIPGVVAESISFTVEPA